MPSLVEFHPSVAAQVWEINARQVVLQVARNAGLPVDMPAVQQGIAALLPQLSANVFALLAQQGVKLVIEDSSPFFADLARQAGGVPRNVRTTYLAPGPAGGNGHPQQPQAAPAPQAPYQQLDPRASQNIRHAHQNPNATPLPPNAIIPGQPLPPLTPGLKQPMPSGQPVPLEAPIMPGPANDAPPSATSAPSVVPSFD